MSAEFLIPVSLGLGGQTSAGAADVAKSLPDGINYSLRFASLPGAESLTPPELHRPPADSSSWAAGL
jgi:hypothetical protein